jgi:hypothetical protein
MIQTKHVLKWRDFRDVNRNGMKNPASELKTKRRFGSGTVSTKNGLSIVTVTLRDELLEFRCQVLEMIGSSLKNFGC